MAYQPIIIIGAPRSGTNMLRNMLTELPGVGTWGCDEINYIWRHGNITYHSDEFTPEMAIPKVQSFIRGEFDKIAINNSLDTLIEKTCANSLRVGFVNKVIPDAKYIYIVREGIDVVASAIVRWHAKFDFLYIMHKARYVPVTDLPYYASRYIINHMYRILSREKRLAFWGPVINGIADLQLKHSIAEICALQWKTCVENTERDFLSIPEDNIYRIKYENFVLNPIVEFSRLAEFLNKPVPERVNDYLKTNVKSSSVGRGYKILGEAEVEKLRLLIFNTLERYDY